MTINPREREALLYFAAKINEIKYRDRSAAYGDFCRYVDSLTEPDKEPLKERNPDGASS